MRAALLILLALTVAQLAKSIDLTTKAELKRCRSRTLLKCEKNGRVCMRFSRTNLCEYFQSECQQKLDNCNKGGVTQAFYEKVNWKYCIGMPMNQRLPCGYRPNKNNNRKKVNNTRIIFG